MALYFTGTVKPHRCKASRAFEVPGRVPGRVGVDLVPAALYHVEEAGDVAKEPEETTQPKERSRLKGSSCPRHDGLRPEQPSQVEHCWGPFVALVP